MDQARADELSEQNAASWKQQADTAVAYLTILQKQAASFITQRQQLFADLYRVMLDARKTSMSTTVTDATLADVAKDALLMTMAVWPEYSAQMAGLT